MTSAQLTKEFRDHQRGTFRSSHQFNLNEAGGQNTNPPPRGEGRGEETSSNMANYESVYQRNHNTGASEGSGASGSTGASGGPGGSGDPNGPGGPGGSDGNGDKDDENDKLKKLYKQIKKKLSQIKKYK